MLNRELQYARTRGQNNTTWGGPVETFIKIRLNFKPLHCGTSFRQNVKELTNLAALKGQYMHHSL